MGMCPECVLLCSTYEEALQLAGSPAGSPACLLAHNRAQPNGLTRLHALALVGASPPSASASAAVAEWAAGAANGGLLEAQLDNESKYPLHQL